MYVSALEPYMEKRLESTKPLGFPRGFDGGAKRDRTADLYNAIVALSQLSYGPNAYVPLALYRGWERMRAEFKGLWCLWQGENGRAPY